MGFTKPQFYDVISSNMALEINTQLIQQWVIYIYFKQKFKECFAFTYKYIYILLTNIDEYMGRKEKHLIWNKMWEELGYRKLRWEMHRNLEQNGDKSGLNCGINVLPVWRLGLADRILVMLVPVLQLLAGLLLQLVLLQFFLAIFLLQTGLLVFTPLPYLFGFFANDRSGCVWVSVRRS